MLARDPLGVKPLYFAHLNGEFAFSSEIKALVKLMPNIRSLDHEALRRYFSFIYCPGPATPFKSVRKLEPGSAMWVDKDLKLKKWTFYKLPSLDPSNEQMSELEAVEGVYTRLNTAVKRQMISDVPLGAFLSGGIDSTSIVAFARKVAPDIKCFTIRTVNGRDAGETDDLPFAAMAARHLDVSLDVVDVEASQIPQDLEKMVWHLDEPIADPASLNTLYISQMARNQGTKVLLSGTGGDDLFSGYRRHQALKFQSYFDNLPSYIRKGMLSLVKMMPAKAGLSRRRDKLVKIIENSRNIGLPAYFLWGLEEDMDQLFLSCSEENQEDVMYEFLKHASETASPLQRMLALEQRFFLADHNLNYADKMGMAASVEIRVPFLDLDLVNFASKIPDRFKTPGTQVKWVLKNAMRNELPRQILTRPKTGFGLPIRQWVREDLNEYIRDMLSETSIRKRGLFDPKFVQSLIRDNNSGGRDAAFTLFSLLCVEIWCQQNLD